MQFRAFEMGSQKGNGAIQYWLLATARHVGLTCTKEAALPNGERPGDVLIHNWGGQGPMALDITCVHPLRPSESRPTPESVRKSLGQDEHLKRTKYSQKCAEVGWRFMPLAVHPFAGSTTDGSQFLYRLARLYAENTTVGTTKAERVTHFWNTFSITIMREVTTQLRLTTYTGPQGPVLPHIWPTDYFGNNIPTTQSSRPKRQRAEAAQHQPYAQPIPLQ